MSTLRVGWFVAGSLDTASTRFIIRAIEDLNKLSYGTHYLLSANSKYYLDIESSVADCKQLIIKHKINCVIFYKVCLKNAREICIYCNERNIPTIFFTGDWIETEMFNLCRKSIVCSEYTKALVKDIYGKTDVFVWKDYLHRIINKKIPINRSNIVLGWYGYYPKLAYLNHIYSNVLNKKYNLITASNTPIDYPYKVTYRMGHGTNVELSDDVITKMLLEQVDVVIVPIDLRDEKDKNIAFAKSANRIIYPMALGVPVVCNIIPSYKEVIVDGGNGFLVKTESDWVSILKKLEDYRNRTLIGLESQKIYDKFRYDILLKDFMEYLEGCED